MKRRYFCVLSILLSLCLLTALQGEEPVPSSPSSSRLDLSSLSGTLPSSGAESGERPTAAAVEKNSSILSESTPAAEKSRSSKKSTFDLWTLIKAGGSIGVILLVLSVVACGIVIQLLLMLRRSALFPEDLRREFTRLVESGRLRQAQQICQADPSLLARILGTALAGWQGDWASLERKVEDSVAEESSALYRKAETLSVIGNIAPMLGLLGTVIGMVIAFGELAVSDGLGRDLAQGIYFALVTTVDGLLVAIPSLLAFALLNNRIAARTVELVHQLERLLKPLRTPSSSSSSTPPLPPLPHH